MTVRHRTGDLTAHGAGACRPAPTVAAAHCAVGYGVLETLLSTGDASAVGWVEWDVPDAILDVRVPALVVQPLVESAVRHGEGSSRYPTRRS